MERTLVIIKSESVQRRIIGELMSCFENKGLKLVASKLKRLTITQAACQYRAYENEVDFKDYVISITSSPVMLLVYEGDGVVKMAQAIIQNTFDDEAERNELIYASNSIDGSEIDVLRFFAEAEIFTYNYNEDAKWRI